MKANGHLIALITLLIGTGLHRRPESLTLKMMIAEQYSSLLGWIKRRVEASRPWALLVSIVIILTTLCRNRGVPNVLFRRRNY